MRAPPLFLLLFLSSWLMGPGAARAETLTLEDCLREAAEKNPAIVTQRFAVQQAFGTRLELRSRALPRLGVSVVAGQQGSQGITVLREQKVRLANGAVVTVPEQRVERNSNLFALGAAALLQPLFDVGIPAAWRRGSLEVIAAQQNFATVASTQLHNTRLRFYRALYQREAAAVLRLVAARLDANVNTAGELVKAGLTGQQILLQARVQRANFVPDTLAAEGGYRVALTELLGLMGRDLGAASGGGKGDLIERVTLAGSLEDGPTPAFDPAKAAAEALAQRPDLNLQREIARQTAEDARITRAGYYPRIQVFLSGTAVPQNFVRSSNSVRPGDDVRTTELVYGARYDWNVVDTGAVRGPARRIDALREAVLASVQRLEQSVPRDLAQLRAQLDANAAQVAIAQGNRAIAEETLNIVERGVAQGANNQLEFIDAQTGLLNTRTVLLQAQAQLAYAKAEFDRITGGYLRFVPEEKPAGRGAPDAGRTDKHP